MGVRSDVEYAPCVRPPRDLLRGKKGKDSPALKAFMQCRIKKAAALALKALRRTQRQ